MIYTEYCRMGWSEKISICPQAMACQGIADFRTGNEYGRIPSFANEYMALIQPHSTTFEGVFTGAQCRPRSNLRISVHLKPMQRHREYYVKTA